jgi:hypothetical protein
MKKIMLSIASVLFVGAVAVTAQVTQDTTRSRSQGVEGTSGTSATQGSSSSSSSQDQQGGSSTSQSTSGTEGTTGSASYQNQRDLVRVQSSDVPASLRSTLQGAEYKGWENGTVYRNKTTNEYVVEVGDGTNKKTYRFDRNGKRVGDNGAMPNDKD